MNITEIIEIIKAIFLSLNIATSVLMIILIVLEVIMVNKGGVENPEKQARDMVIRLLITSLLWGMFYYMNIKT